MEHLSESVYSKKTGKYIGAGMGDFSTETSTLDQMIQAIMSKENAGMDILQTSKQYEIESYLYQKDYYGALDYIKRNHLPHDFYWFSRATGLVFIANIGSRYYYGFIYKILYDQRGNIVRVSKFILPDRCDDFRGHELGKVCSEIDDLLSE